MGLGDGIARCFEHGVCVARIFRFEIAAEAIDEKHYLAAPAVLGWWRPIYVSSPLGQLSLRAQTGEWFGQRSQTRYLVPQIQEWSKLAGHGRESRQRRSEFLANRSAMALVPLVQEFDFHPGHINAGRTLAATRFATHAKVHDFFHAAGDHGVRAELPSQRQTEAVGAAARHILLIFCSQITRTHHARVHLAAVAIVVAHLHGAEQSARARPIERGFHGHGSVSRLVTEIPPVIHARRAHDPPWIEKSGRIECVLDRFKGADYLISEHGAVKLGADDAV